jgi:hypothetical protein
MGASEPATSDATACFRTYLLCFLRPRVGVEPCSPVEPWSWRVAGGA